MSRRRKSDVPESDVSGSLLGRQDHCDEAQFGKRELDHDDVEKIVVVPPGKVVKVEKIDWRFLFSINKNRFPQESLNG
jgi:hypothetical protein